MICLCVVDHISTIGKKSRLHVVYQAWNNAQESFSKRVFPFLFSISSIPTGRTVVMYSLEVYRLNCVAIREKGGRITSLET